MAIVKKRFNLKKLEMIFVIFLFAVISEYMIPNQVIIQKLVYVLFGAYAVYIIANSPKNILNRKAQNIVVFGMFPISCMFIYTLLLSIFDANTHIVLQSATTSAYLILDMLTAFSLFVLYKTEAINIIYYSTVLSYCIGLFIVINTLGLKGTYLDFISGLSGLNSQIERNDIGTSVVLLILYFILNLRKINKSERKKYYFRIIVLLVIMYLSGKRSAVVGIAVGVFIASLYKLKSKFSSETIFISALIVISALFSYLALIKTGVLNDISVYLGINSMGRLYVWSWFDSMYELLPMYFGKGFQYVHIYMENFSSDGMVHDFGYLHNSILQLYIELGFVGFIMYFFFYLYSFPMKIWKVFGRKTMQSFICLYLCTIAIYLTDNVLTYPVYQLTLFSCLLNCGGEELEESRNKFHCSSL